MSDKYPAADADSVSLPSVVPDSFSATSSSAAVCLLDPEQRVVWLNNELAALNGVAASRLFGRTLRDVLGPFAEQIQTHLHVVQAGGEPLLNVEISGFHSIRQAAVRWRLHLFPIRDEQGKLTRFGMIVNELTGRDQLARAVQELDSKLHKDADRLQMLAEINNLLSSNWDVPLLFPRVSARIRRALRQEMASFVLYDAENHKLVRHALDFPLSKGLILQGPVSAENTPVQLALDQGTPSIFSAKELENLQNSMARSLLDEGLRSLCCVPMMRPNGPFGALILGSTRSNAFHEDDLGFLTQVANQLALAMVNHFAASEIKVLRERLGEEGKYLEGEIEYEGQFTEIVGSSPALRAVLQQVTAVAASGATVLILGETGTGKELIARAIHRLSQRKEGPFHQGELRCNPDRPAGERTLRPRKRSLYGRHQPEGWAHGACPSRDSVLGRSG
jgi:GAF domain-containing protein